MQSKPLSVPSVIVRIRRVDLVALNACESGLAAFDRIACMQGNPTRVRFRATLTHQLWLATAYPSFTAWLREHGLLPPMFAKSGADLGGANLYGADLGGADLYGANLYGADLYGADLRGANLYGANLYGADLGGVYWIKSRPAPDGWTHDPPAAHCEWVVLRRSL